MTNAEFAAWRAALRLTRPEAAQLLQLSPAQIYRLEHGLSRVTPQTALLCRLLVLSSVRDVVKQLVHFRTRRRNNFANLLLKNTLK